MKSIVICSVVLALGMFCSAEEESAEQSCRMKEWMQFNEEIKGDLCKPDTTEDKALSALIECKSVLGSHMEKFEKFKEMGEKLYEKCGTPNEADVSAYSKCDLTNVEHKKLLMNYCSDNMKTCIYQQIKEMKESGQFKKPEESEKPKLTDEEKEQLKTCMKKAASGGA